MEVMIWVITPLLLWGLLSLSLWGLRKLFAFRRRLKLRLNCKKLEAERQKQATKQEQAAKRTKGYSNDHEWVDLGQSVKWQHTT